MSHFVHPPPLSCGGLLRRGVAFLVACVCVAGSAHAQRAPRIGYVYPAGGQINSTFEVIVGGQFLELPIGAVISGDGVQVLVLEHDKLPNNLAVDEIRTKVREMQGKMRTLRTDGKLSEAEMLPTIRRLLREANLTEKELRQMKEFDRRRNDPKQQLNTQIGETVRLKVTIAENAEPGLRHWRLRTANGLSNPMRFAVGQHPEVREVVPPLVFDFDGYRGYSEAEEKAAAKAVVTPTVSLPVTINGRILPGEVDKFSFHAKKGDQVVLSVQARQLIPYLADAVPGWFQAVTALYDSSGRELAFAGSYRFDPDPVVFYKIPEAGDYRIEVHDSIYRGREDFVYRITLGELPFLTGISPLGAPAGSKTDLTFLGGNLGDQYKLRYTAPDDAGIASLYATRNGLRSNSIPFQVDTIPEEPEREPNNAMGVSHEARTPLVVHGRIDAPGDVDFFRLKGPGNRPLAFEIFARRLGSPLDSTLAVFDAEGKQIAINDDHEDPASGLTTHHADSRITVKMPSSGVCFVRVSDTQIHGGITHAYRLRITHAPPSFALRVTPSTLNASPGGTVRLTVHALRVDGFDGEIALKLKDAPKNFALREAKIPAGEASAEISLTVPSTVTEEPVALHIQGTAGTDGTSAVVDAAPAEDMMQAFLYRHLVTVDDLLVDVRTPPERPKPTP